MANDVTIRVNYKDITDAYNQAVRLRDVLQTLNTTVYTPRFDLQPFREALGLLGQINTQLQNTATPTTSEMTRIATGIERVTSDIYDQQRAWMDEERTRRQQHEEEMRRQQEEQRHLQTTMDLINGIAHAIEGLGSISNATATFANGLGSAFSSMAGLFDTDVMKYATASLTHQFMQNLVGNTSAVTSRYDILNTFIPYMSIMGVSASSATEAQNRIDQSIRGLPIGLDEATQRLRRYFMYTGNLDYATDLTIGVQNAIAAGGADTGRQTQAYNMIERMLATGDLTNIRQWQSLLVGMGVSQKFIEQELGLGSGQLLDAIRQKTISVQEFLDALARIGDGASEAAQGINTALEIYKTTLESWMKNIAFAVVRGNQRVLDQLDETLKDVSGKGITGYMSDYRDMLNDLFTGVAGFVKNNPDLVSQFLSDMEKLFNSISKVSASHIASSVAANITTLIDSVTYLFDKIPKDRFESFVAFATTIAGPVGKLFETVSSGAPYMIAVFDRFENFDWKLLIDAITRNVDNLARFFEDLLNFFSDKQLADIIAFGLTYGKPLAAVLTAIGHSLSTIGAFFLLGGGNRVIAVLDALTSFLTNIAGIIGGIGLGGLILGGVSTPFALVSNWHRNQQAGSYTGTNEDLNAEILALRSFLNDPSQVYDENGYELPGVAAYRARLDVLERVRENRGGLGGQKKRKDTYNSIRNKRIAFSLWGNADKFAWLETMGMNDYIPVATEAAAEATADLAAEIYEAQKAYQDLYDSARESLEGQISLWDKISLNKDVHYVASDAGNSKANMEYNTGIVERYADAVTYLSDYVSAHPEAAGYIGQMVGTMDIADLATIENLVAYIQAGKDLPLDAWNALADAIDRATDALTRWKELNGEREYSQDEARGIIQQIFGTDPDVLGKFDELWGDLEKTTEKGMKVFRDTIYKWLVQTGKITQEEVDKLNAAFSNIGIDPSILYGTAADMMDALRRGIITVGDKAVWEARRIAYNVLHAFDGLTYQMDQNAAEALDRQVYSSSGGLIYAANGRFIPRGTDTVPAMLTPGEFVMRKQAVDTFGAAFMKSINDLNIGAAFDRLINTKLSNPRGFVNNTYNTRDDHSTHIQNIKTNNPYFASRRAGRFVRAMA